MLPEVLSFCCVQMRKWRILHQRYCELSRSRGHMGRPIVLDMCARDPYNDLLRLRYERMRGPERSLHQLAKHNSAILANGRAVSRDSVEVAFGCRSA